MLSFSEVRATLIETFPATKPVYQDAVAERMALYLSFLNDWKHRFKGSIIDVGGQYGNFLCIAERIFPELEAMTLTRYPLVVANTLALRSRSASVVSCHCERDQIPAYRSVVDVAVSYRGPRVSPVRSRLDDDGNQSSACARVGRCSLRRRTRPAAMDSEHPEGKEPRRVDRRQTASSLRTTQPYLHQPRGDPTPGEPGFTVVGFSTIPSQKVLLVSKVLRMLRLADREFPQHCGAEALIIAEKHTHFSPLLEYPKETRWPSWLILHGPNYA